MNFANELSLLFAVAVPVVVIAGMQVALYVAGERHTLLLPGMAAYPSTAYPQPVDVKPQSQSARRMPAPSNDEIERLAA